LFLADDIIKNRRKTTTTTRRAPAGKPTAADKAMGRQRATRTATVNARRGIQTSNKPSAMEIEREVYRQSRMSTPATKSTTTPSRRNQKDSAAQVKARKQKKEQQKAGKPAQRVIPVSVGGPKRAPSQKAIVAAVEAMSSKGFNVPKGMQMVISFAPAAAPAPAPQKKPEPQKKTGPNQQGGNANKGKQNIRNKGSGRRN
jgi:hypothetical protein